MPPSLPTLDPFFAPWKDICVKYDAICEGLLTQHPSKEDADRKEESIHWEQTAFELLILLLVALKVPFDTGADCVQKIIKTQDGKDKEIDFSIFINGTELFFGVTSFSDSEKDFSKDLDVTDIPITDLKYPDGTVSDTAKITTVRSHRAYLDRRLVVRVAKEGKHLLPSDYIYIAFPKIAPGFGRGLDAIAKDFSFGEGDYTFPENGITGLILIGEYLNIQPKRKSIERDIWLIKTKAFPHASETARDLLLQLDGKTIDMRPKFEDIRKLMADTTPGTSPNA
jgi:hypothetical protein